ncbi:murein biosynthesis integral membrane protein MurJ [Streptomyces sp. NPDC127033]|uniref:murein biosynthesis integral membrane protein MurJ n=1 Tax=Streptomyces sp. NPDC127033 TaxID=3347110 RepID=UPI00364F5EAD
MSDTRHSLPAVPPPSTPPPPDTTASAAAAAALTGAGAAAPGAAAASGTAAPGVTAPGVTVPGVTASGTVASAVTAPAGTAPGTAVLEPAGPTPEPGEPGGSGGRGGLGKPEEHREPGEPREPGGRAALSSGRFLARAAFLTAALTAAGSLLGLLRDQTIAHLYGAGPDTDAFLVAWTVPEVAATLLIEDAMALILVPAFSLALARRAARSPQDRARDLAQDLDLDPVRQLTRATLPRLFLALSACAALLIALAPWAVAVLAPGLPEPRLAVDCTRLTATSIFTYGVAGYCSAALRAHGSFVAPAAIYVASNVGIISTMLLAGAEAGVLAAGAGVAVGGVMMVLIQLPTLWNRLTERRPVSGLEPAPASATPTPTPAPVPVPATETASVSASASASASAPAPAPASVTETTPTPAATSLASPVALGLLVPVVAFALSRQSQVLVERFLAAPLPAGAISHLNYAQKVAQIPMTLSLMLCTVTFPVVARAMAAGETDRARRRVERDLALAGIIVLIGAATVISCAPQIIEVLFQRGEFHPADTAATAAVMRVYALGLLGHTLVGALVRCYFSAARPLWFPALAMTAGLALTGGAGALLVGVWGVRGIAAANALGITLTAVLMLGALHRHSVPVRTRHMTGGLVKLSAAAAAATGSGWLCAALLPSPVLATLSAGLVVTAVFLVIAYALKAPETDSILRSLARPFSRKLADAR